MHLCQIGVDETWKKDKTPFPPRPLSQDYAMGTILTLTVGTNFLLTVPALVEQGFLITLQSDIKGGLREWHRSKNAGLFKHYFYWQYTISMGNSIYQTGVCTKVPKKACFLFSALQVMTWAILQIKREHPGTLELEHWNKILALLQSSHALTMLRLDFFASLMKSGTNAVFSLYAD